MPQPNDGSQQEQTPPAGSPLATTPASPAPAPAQAPTAPEPTDLQAKLEHAQSQVNGVKSKLASVEAERDSLKTEAELAAALRVENKILKLVKGSTLPATVVKTIEDQMAGMQFETDAQVETFFNALAAAAQSAAPAPAAPATPGTVAPAQAPAPNAAPNPAPRKDDAAGANTPPPENLKNLKAEERIALGFQQNKKARTGEGQAFV